mmetsp:Transcript_14307/g.50238  ORF Transcript_14307/g.50238 Transcript_14307/m.50238 type:complete len:134 (+) Transcript_14307:1274-1675(+)
MLNITGAMLKSVRTVKVETSGVSEPEDGGAQPWNAVIKVVVGRELGHETLDDIWEIVGGDAQWGLMNPTASDQRLYEPDGSLDRPGHRPAPAGRAEAREHRRLEDGRGGGLEPHRGAEAHKNRQQRAAGVSAS